MIVLCTSVVTVAFLGALSSRPRPPERAARPDVGDLLAIPMDEHASVDHRIEGVGGRSLDDDVDSRRERADL